MKIKNYSLHDKAAMQFVKSDDEIRMNASANNDAKGTEEHPYELGEYITLFLNGEWEGGYVSPVGYISKDQSSITFPSTSEFDWDQYFSSVFGFLSNSNTYSFDISSSSSSTSETSDETQSFDYNAQMVNISVSIGSAWFNFNILIMGRTAIISASATTRDKIENGEFRLKVDHWTIGLYIDSSSTIGNYQKYKFKKIHIPYSEDKAIYLLDTYNSIRIL
ncbi:hypothetical protein [Hallella seregens]|uniref:Uncharacterized protein n=1 Tax=Hallella seregens ATCC 51272 TaxID=1336250 RepID=A0ABV5ZKH3_9BACT|nr:hypothetical protein [Hallella seregens]